MRWELARKLARTERAQFLVEALDLEAATDLAGAEWEPFQLAHLNDDGLMRHERKSRQIGWSWLAAAEAVAVATLYPRSTCLFVSINREESAEKIRYAKQVYEALYPQWRVPLTNDNLTSITFANGSRILSMPQRPIRGKAKAWLYLDEFAHYRLDAEIYQAGVYVTTKGGRIRIGSTTLGARGKFWEIGEQRIRPYPGYVRSVTPWFAVGSLIREGLKLRDVTREAWALGDAPGATEERVARFGSQRMQELFANTPLDDWLQEMECQYIDEAMAYIPWADILACTMADSGGWEGRDAWVESEDGLFVPSYQVSEAWVTRTPEQAFAALDQIQGAVASGRIRGALCWGMDIGRKKDLSEITILERRGNTHTVRAIFSLDRTPFEAQEALCRRLLSVLPVVRGYLDQNGLGMMLAEHLHLREAHGERAMPMVFSQPSKALMATHLKSRFQRGQGDGGIRIPDDRDLKYQIHSVRRRVTLNNTVVFDVEASERHHADKFWSLALANEAGETLERIEAYPIQSPVTYRTTQRLDSMLTSDQRAEMPDLGDAVGFGLTQDQFNALVEQGLNGVAQMLARAYASQAVPAARVVEADAPVGAQTS